MRKRSKYKPKAVLIDPVRYVINGFRPINDVGSEVVTLRLKYHTAMQALISGEATISDIDTLIVASNMTFALKRCGIGGGYEDVAIAGANAIEAIRNRARKWQKVQATPKEIDAISHLMELHDAQLDVARVVDVDVAVKMARDKEQTEGV